MPEGILVNVNEVTRRAFLMQGAHLPTLVCDLMHSLMTHNPQVDSLIGGRSATLRCSNTHFTLASTLQKTVMIQAGRGLVVSVSSHPRREGGKPCQPTTAVTEKDTWVIMLVAKYGPCVACETPKQSHGLWHVSHPRHGFLEDLCERLPTYRVGYDPSPQFKFQL